ncbi:MAG TPA: CYCXC family (seleno)protein [Candidatus Binataceae bacterium]
MKRKAEKRDIAVAAALIFLGSFTFIVLGRYRGLPPVAQDPSALAEVGGSPTGVRDPESFSSPAREAYRAARSNAALFAQLHCYCGCDRTAGHKSLLDCFRDHHGASCETCVGEALDAQRMASQGSPVVEIQQALKARYQHPG